MFNALTELVNKFTMNSANAVFNSFVQILKQGVNYRYAANGTYGIHPHSFQPIPPLIPPQQRGEHGLALARVTTDKGGTFGRTG